MLLFKSTFTNDLDFRVFLDGEDEPWFVGIDICGYLNYKNNRKALHDNVDNEDKTAFMHFNKRNCYDSNSSCELPIIHPHTTLINESGLYSLILRSKLPAAKAFKRWVTAEVLPSIRKHGEYTKLQLENKLKELETERTWLQEENCALCDEVDTLSASITTLSSENDSLSTDIVVLSNSLKQTEFAKEKLEKDHARLQRNHNVILTKRSYHKFKKGPCFYIVKDDWRERNYFKIGETGDINVRLTHYRVAMPRTKILYLLYLGENKMLETNVKAKFKQYLSDQNKEYIAGVPLEKIIDQVETMVKYFHLDATCERELNLYNKAIDIEENMTDSELPISDYEQDEDSE